MRSSGPGRRARQFDGRYAYAFWPISSAFTIVGTHEAGGSHNEEPGARPVTQGWVDEPLLTIVPSARDSRSRA